MLLLRPSLRRFFFTAALLCAAVLSRAAEIPLYVGTYKKPGPAEGIYLCRFDTETGALSEPELAVKTEGPGFLVQHPTKKVVYAVDQAEASVSAFAVEEGGKLRRLNRQPSRGEGPTHLAIDRDGRNLLVANYNGGSVACLPIAADGTLQPAVGFDQRTGKGTDPKRQEAPHAHSIYVGRDNTHVYSCDLGLDKIFVYRLDVAKGTLTPADPPFAATAPGSGARHLAFSAGDKFIYSVNELSSTITVFAREDGREELRRLQEITTLPADFKGENSTSEIWVHPSQKFLYASNRGHNSLAAFAIAPDGRLSFLAHTPTQGDHPRYFGFDPTGAFLLVGNMFSHTIVVFHIDEACGALTPVGLPVKCFQPSAFLFPKW